MYCNTKINHTKVEKIIEPKKTASEDIKDRASKIAMAHKKKIYSVMFEVFGRVQGVYFRKHTQNKAKEYGLNGWCMNTREGTVKGIMEGPQDLISEMKLWLQHKGSPRSIIERAIFTPLEPISEHNFSSFSIRR